MIAAAGEKKLKLSPKDIEQQQRALKQKAKALAKLVTESENPKPNGAGKPAPPEEQNQSLLDHSGKEIEILKSGHESVRKAKVLLSQELKKSGVKVDFQGLVIGLERKRQFGNRSYFESGEEQKFVTCTLGDNRIAKVVQNFFTENAKPMPIRGAPSAEDEEQERQAQDEAEKKLKALVDFCESVYEVLQKRIDASENPAAEAAQKKGVAAKQCEVPELRRNLLSLAKNALVPLSELIPDVLTVTADKKNFIQNDGQNLVAAAFAQIDEDELSKKGEKGDASPS